MANKKASKKALGKIGKATGPWEPSAKHLLVVSRTFELETLLMESWRRSMCIVIATAIIASPSTRGSKRFVVQFKSASEALAAVEAVVKEFDGLLE